MAGAPIPIADTGREANRGAACPACPRPLLLFWDIDCSDPRFQTESAPVFGDLKRLPLYHCFRRPEPTTYRVEAEDRIRTFTPDLAAHECPDPACATHKTGHSIIRPKRRYQMKVRAVIDADAGFGMDTKGAQIVFHVCWKCLTMRAAYRIDRTIGRRDYRTRAARSPEVWLSWLPRFP